MQGVVVEAPPVSSSYAFEYCQLFSSATTNRDCVVYATATVQIAPMVPAFVYKYEVNNNGSTLSCILLLPH